MAFELKFFTLVRDMCFYKRVSNILYCYRVHPRCLVRDIGRFEKLHTLPKPVNWRQVVFAIKTRRYHNVYFFFRISLTVPIEGVVVATVSSPRIGKSTDAKNGCVCVVCEYNNNDTIRCGWPLERRVCFDYSPKQLLLSVQSQ